MALKLNDLKSFVTGSHAYGTPGPHSDIDLVVLVSEDTHNLLQSLADSVQYADYGASPGGRPESGTPLRFGRVNLLCCTDYKAFEVWKRGTQDLADRAAGSGGKITRGEAVAHFRKLREEAGIAIPRKVT